MKSKGMNTFVRSWVPNPRFDGGKNGEKDGYEILGMVIRHGEAYTIPLHLSGKDCTSYCCDSSFSHGSLLSSV